VYRIYFARCMNIFNLLLQRVKYVHTTRFLGSSDSISAKTPAPIFTINTSTWNDVQGDVHPLYDRNG